MLLVLTLVVHPGRFCLGQSDPNNSTSAPAPVISPSTANVSVNESIFPTAPEAAPFWPPVGNNASGNFSPSTPTATAGATLQSVGSMTTKSFAPSTFTKISMQPLQGSNKACTYKFQFQVADDSNLEYWITSGSLCNANPPTTYDSHATFTSNDGLLLKSDTIFNGRDGACIIFKCNNNYWYNQYCQLNTYDMSSETKCDSSCPQSTSSYMGDGGQKVTINSADYYLSRRAAQGLSLDLGKIWTGKSLSTVAAQITVSDYGYSQNAHGVYLPKVGAPGTYWCGSGNMGATSCSLRAPFTASDRVSVSLNSGGSVVVPGGAVDFNTVVLNNMYYNLFTGYGSSDGQVWMYIGVSCTSSSNDECSLVPVSCLNSPPVYVPPPTNAPVYVPPPTNAPVYVPPPTNAPVYVPPPTYNQQQPAVNTPAPYWSSNPSPPPTNQQQQYQGSSVTGAGIIGSSGAGEFAQPSLHQILAVFAAAQVLLAILA
ncbi:hypothetical protein KFL_009520020 [Klebsormidium nitens]|uniref:Uncharacterized protein n=1 Tax=Klebsormidium nitens TaxID=105231 RepID=A0A1Y1IQA8_KLENI|nr:hypothetical protein KFL_009520020 [Klebsormidium nitens]|eukprot:GAQ92232.1 hypothetical protein KFL_009520020 [Klebsormidium nitens]